MWTDHQFWMDSTWRAFRTFCQSLAGLLLAVQTSDQISAIPSISVPWYGYIYSSGVAALISLLQSIDRERAVGNTEPPADTATTETPVASSDANYIPPAALVSGCGADPR